METSGPTSTRRDFLTKVLPAGTLACLGCTKLCGLFRSAYAQEAEGQHKFLADSEMSAGCGRASRHGSRGEVGN